MREKLIDVFMHLDRHISNRDEYGICFTSDFVKAIEDVLVMLKNQDANGVTVQKWIPVTERLPEEWVDVLVLSRYGFCEVAVYLGIPGKWRITWNHDLFEVDSITHWMLLPEPPKED